MRNRGELGAAVAEALLPGRILRRAQLGGEHMNGRRREIREAPGVVEVEMGRHDMAHVGDAEAEGGDLSHRRLGDLKPGPRDGSEKPSEPARVGDVLDPEPAVDEDQAVLALDQQAVAAHRPADERGPHGTHRSAIEMMEAHARPSLARQGA